MLLPSAVALLVGQFLPGLFLVEAAKVGASREERLLLAAIAGGPLLALAHLASLAAGTPVLFWLVTGALAAGGLLLGRRSRLAAVWPRRSKLVLAAIAAAVLLPYLLTTGSLYRVDGDGRLLLDRALQRDTLFHLGVIHSLEADPRPALLSVSGLPIGYHVGYHARLAALSRHFGVDPMDALIRVGAPWELALLVLAAYLLARRFTESESARLLASLLVLAAGFGFAAFFRSGVDWWSLAFLDVSLVSLFLANPLLPAVPLLFAGLALLGDYFETKTVGSICVSAFLLGFLLAVKMFAGAQLLAALGMACLGRFRDRRAWTALAVLSLASLPLVVRTALAAGSSNTSVSLRPFEIARYSMEKLGWEGAVSALASIGRFDEPVQGFAFTAAIAFVWIVGFLGLRLAGIPEALNDLVSPDGLRRTMAWFVAIGLGVALVFRIAPAESEGLSRLEAQNDVVWFAAQSGLLLWFWTAVAVVRFRPFVALPAIALLALPGTVQHFVRAARLEPDRIGATRLAAAREARAVSPPGAVWIDPVDRARPSLLPYVAGRAVVYDPYVGYDYMFVGRAAIDERRHALAQFWTADDPAYAAWVLDSFDVGFVWEEGRTLPDAARLYLEHLYDNGDVVLHRVREAELRAGLRLGLAPPGEIPMGGPGHPYFGSGWEWPRGQRFRLLPPGTVQLYVPRERGEELELALDVELSRGEGVLEIEGQGRSVAAGRRRVSVTLGPPGTRGLSAIPLRWSGDVPLRVTRIAVMLRHDADPVR